MLAITIVPIFLGLSWDSALMVRDVTTALLSTKKKYLVCGWLQYPLPYNWIILLLIFFSWSTYQLTMLRSEFAKFRMLHAIKAWTRVTAIEDTSLRKEVIRDYQYSIDVNNSNPNPIIFCDSYSLTLRHE